MDPVKASNAIISVAGFYADALGAEIERRTKAEQALQELARVMRARELQEANRSNEYAELLAAAQSLTKIDPAWVQENIVNDDRAGMTSEEVIKLAADLRFNLQRVRNAVEAVRNPPKVSK